MRRKDRWRIVAMIINVMHEGGVWHGDPSVTSVTTHVPSSQRQPSHPPTWAKNITTTSLNDNPCNAKYIFCKQSTPTTRATFALTFIKTILVSICPLAVAWGLCQNQRGRTSSDVWAACVRGSPSVSWMRIFHPYSCTFLSPPWEYHLANKCTTLICTKLGTVLDK